MRLPLALKSNIALLKVVYVIVFGIVTDSRPLRLIRFYIPCKIALVEYYWLISKVFFFNYMFYELAISGHLLQCVR